MMPESFLEPSIIFFRVGWDPKSRWTKVKFDGAVLSALDIKRCLMEHMGLRSSPEVFDLVLTNTQTGEEFREEGFLVPRNSALVARKIPCSKEASDRIRDSAMTIDSPGGHNVKENIYGGGRIIGKPTCETDAAVADFIQKGGDFPDITDIPTNVVSGIPNPQEEMINSAQGFGGLRFAYRFDPQAKPPPGYVCHRCEQPGHFIRFCPTNEDPNFNFKRIKPATGISGTLVRNTNAVVTNPSDPLNIASSSDLELNAAGKTLAPLTAISNPENPIKIDFAPKVSIRKELICQLCRGAFVNAVLTACCFSSFCDVCIRLHFVKSSESNCPSCGSKECKKEDLKPSQVFQEAVDEYVEKYPRSANSRITRHFDSQPGVLRMNDSVGSDFMNQTAALPPSITQSRALGGATTNHTCFKCGMRGHYMASCPRRKENLLQRHYGPPLMPVERPGTALSKKGVKSTPKGPLTSKRRRSSGRKRSRSRSRRSAKRSSGSRKPRYVRR